MEDDITTVHFLSFFTLFCHFFTIYVVRLTIVRGLDLQIREYSSSDFTKIETAILKCSN